MTIPVVRRARSDDRGQSIVEFALLAPIMIFLLFAMLDLARIYTAMSSVESAAREAADYGTSLGAEKWSSSIIDDTVLQMRLRACVAASDLHDYAGTDGPPADGIDEDCSNPDFRACIAGSTGGTCLDVEDMTQRPGIDGLDCDNPERDPPCTVTVTMAHTFHLFVPIHLDFFGVKLGLPVSLPFERDSTYAMTDIDVNESPSPDPSP